MMIAATVPGSRQAWAKAITSNRSLSLWWWGDDEAPGLGRWLKTACSAFELSQGIHVDARRLRHTEVLPGFPIAWAAGEAPDLHFFWNGIYMMESVWGGQLEALDLVLERQDLIAIGGGPMSRWEGRTYRAGWYVIPVVWVANRSVLSHAGVNGLPSTWDEFLYACERVRRRDRQPITVGDVEGDFSIWWLTHLLTQELDAAADAARLVFGELDWRLARYWSPWARLEQVRDAGFLDQEALPLTLWDGLARFNEGGSAFTLASGPMFTACRAALGGSATVMVAPAAAAGRLARLPIVDTQGLGVASSSINKQAAAAFLCHLHAPEQRRSLWEQVRLFPADTRWQGPHSDDVDYELMWQWWARGPTAPYVPNLLPLPMHYRLAELGQAVLAGDIDGERAGTEARAAAADWVRLDAGRAERYRAWVHEVAAELDGLTALARRGEDRAERPSPVSEG
jgi:ABC-type glycerol-3-phosphate transport system substrate-binding protein